MTPASPNATIVAEIALPMSATLERDDQGWTLVLRRQFRHQPERLWQMLTDPDRLARWSPIVPNRPLTTAGPATCRENPNDAPIDAEVIRVNPPRELVHRWGADLLHWIVTPDAEGSVLELRQSVADRTMASSYAAGWQVCFGTLAATADGTERPRVVGMAAMDYGWQPLNDAYAAAFDAQERESAAVAVAARMRGVFLTSEAPQETARFYRDVAGVPLEVVGEPDAYQYWRLDRDGMQLAIHDAEAFATYAFPAVAASNLTHLYFTIDDHAAFLAHLSRLGVEPVDTDDVVITVEDPDGRKVMFGTA